jgi:5-methylcytosine-specific restriction endonuclease McrA
MSSSSLGYSRAAWQAARAAALQRARHRCQRCGSTDQLVVHHRDGRGPMGPRATDPANLIVLCRRHHLDQHRAEHDHPTRVWPPER